MYDFLLEVRCEDGCAELTETCTVDQMHSAFVMGDVWRLVTLLGPQSDLTLQKRG